jgi:tRNA A37 threonylcarbamoyladenosine synthetase subunit TsaC/SUA5/YrdC
VALELLSRTGPLAVSSANRTGLPPATNADDAEAMLGELVRVLLDAGPTPGPVPSTIVDCTAEQGRILRQGALPVERLNEVVAPLGAEIVDEG